MTDDQISEVVFLGICERAAQVREGNTNLFKWNVLGLKQIVLSHIFPLKLSGFTFGFALSNLDKNPRHRIELVHESGKQAGFLDLEVSDVPMDALSAAGEQIAPPNLVPDKGWTITFFRLGECGFFISAPGTYYLQHLTPSGAKIIGQVQFICIDAPPLTPERIAAIRSDPSAAKSIRVELGCNHCDSKLIAYSALEPNAEFESQGWVWHDRLADEFKCGCGGTVIALDTIRRNLHGYLGLRRHGVAELGIVPLYEKTSLETTRAQFAALLETETREELLQQFLEKNPIIFHQFPSHQLFVKPPILTFFSADFALVTPKRELILIELEKATTRLMKKNGGVHSELNHAFDQVRDWLHIVNEHRLAVLDSLRIDRDQVSSVRGVVIAGRDIGYDAHHLRKLKGIDWGAVMLLSYDDLLFAFDALITRMNTV